MIKEELTKEKLDNATARLYRPYFASVAIQNIYYDINGAAHSIEEDSNLIEQLIQEHFQLLNKYKKTQEALDKTCEELARMCHQTSCRNCHFVREQINELNNCPVQGNQTSEDWKEWILTKEKNIQ